MKKLLVGIFIGFALGAATYAIAAPQREARPNCAGNLTLDEFRACTTVRDWCAVYAKFAKPASRPEDPQVGALLDWLVRICPRPWRR